MQQFLLPEEGCELWMLGHQDQGQTAQRFRWAQGQWIPEESIPTDALFSQAEHLGSLTFPSTQVWLNLAGQAKPGDCHQWVWASWFDSPSRWEGRVMGEALGEAYARLNALGKAMKIIIAWENSHLNPAQEAIRIDHADFQTLCNWQTKTPQAPVGFIPKIALLTQLWLRPPSSWRKHRLGFLCAIVLSMLLGSHTSQQALQVQAELLAKEIRNAQSMQNNKTIDWQAWQTQISKFGQGNRAVINHLQVSWAGNEAPNTSLELARPRKRVPKGCQLQDEQLVRCNSSASGGRR